MKNYSNSARTLFSWLILLTAVLFACNLEAQNTSSSNSGQSNVNFTTPSVPVHPTVVSTGTFWGESRPLRDIPPLTSDELKALKIEKSKRRINEERNRYSFPYENISLPKGDDEAWQRTMGSIRNVDSLIVNFEGQESSSWPSDDNGTVGKNHYMQTVNTTYAIYNKSGTLVAGPNNLNQLFGNVPGAGRNDGDPIILYDEQADRWLVTEFSVPKDGTPNYILMAVSKTNDPTGIWYQYSFVAATMPDYPKFGVWRDGYYMGDNNGDGGNDTYVYERSKMLEGQTARVVGFTNPNRPGGTGGFRVVPPLDNDGPFAPSGSPGLYIAVNDDATSGTIDQLWIYELAVNWTTPSSSTFSRVQQLNVTPFNNNFGTSDEHIRQKNTNKKLDAVPQIIMNVPQYRNFGTHQTIVCCHTVNVDLKGRAGIRWYELRKTGTSTTWTIRQQGTYSPDTNSRWMGCILLNSFSTIGLGYSVSSKGEYPGIRYCGQSPAAYAAGNSILDIAEKIILTGSASQTGENRWGDYTSLAIDPSDNLTFWYTNQYATNSTPKTKIAAFKLYDPNWFQSVEEVRSQHVSIMPNPTTGIFRLVPGASNGLTMNVAVVDIAARTILEKQFSGEREYSIDLSHASPGIYNVIIKTKEWTETIKLIVQR